MDHEQRYFPETKFGGFTRLDGTIQFYVRVNALLRPTDTVLDIGCGRGAWADDPCFMRRNLRALKERCARVIGIDVDEAAAANPFVTEFRRIESSTFPIEDAAIDVAVCDHVVEHVEDPAAFFLECRRVLKPGGYLCIRTPNARGYIALAARISPKRHHPRLISVAQPGRCEQDVFPAFYRCNTRSRLEGILSRHGFDACVFGFEAEPSYLGFSRVAYWLGILHQKLTPEALMLSLFCFARKRSQPSCRADS
jgi:SAM-dependent methyltransferase